jgi:hypothetical protein
LYLKSFKHNTNDLYLKSFSKHLRNSKKRVFKNFSKWFCATNLTKDLAQLKVCSSHYISSNTQGPFIGDLNRSVVWREC